VLIERKVVKHNGIQEINLSSTIPTGNFLRQFSLHQFGNYKCEIISVFLFSQPAFSVQIVSASGQKCVHIDLYTVIDLYIYIYTLCPRAVLSSDRVLYSHLHFKKKGKK